MATPGASPGGTKGRRSGLSLSNAGGRGLAYAGLAPAICAVYYVVMEATNCAARMLWH